MTDASSLMMHHRRRCNNMGQNAMQSELAASHTILIVDDETSITRALERLFRMHGYQIITANSGPEGLEKLQTQHNNIALIISDQRMPGMSGAQFLEQAQVIAPDAIRFLLTGYSDMSAVVQAVNEGGIHRYLNKPWNDEGLLLQVKQSLEHFELVSENKRLTALTIEQNKELTDLNQKLEQKVADRIREIQLKNHALLEINKRLENSIKDAVGLLASLADKLSPRLSRHLRETARLSRMIGEEMGLPDATLDKIEMAGMVHDIGFLGMPDDLWTKEPRNLNDEQMRVFSEHPVTSAIILENIDRLSDVSEIILYHHEQVDGHGFPNGFHKDQIPLESKIIAAASEYSRISQTLPRDMGKLIKISRRHFDADVWDRFTIEDDPEPVILEIAEKLILMESNRRFDMQVIATLLKAIGRVNKTPEIISVGINELVPGMVLMADLRVSDGRLLLVKGTKLKEKLLTSIQTVAERGMIPERISVAIPKTGDEK